MDTKIIHLSQNYPEAINSSIDVLKNGGIFIFPTDTVYGIGCLWNKDDAINHIYEIKQRDYQKPLSAYFSSIEMMKDYVADIPDIFYKIAEKNLPGCLTLILNKKDKISNLATSNLQTLGIRIPDNKFIMDLIDKLGEPILGTSANISNEASIKKAGDAFQIFNQRVSLIIEDDQNMIGIESTIIDLTQVPPKILRQGALKLSDIQNIS